MSNNSVDVSSKLLDQIRHLDNKTISKAFESLDHLSRTALEAGSIDQRTKEMIALAIAMASNSRGCIDVHLSNLIKQKLDYRELLEISAIATYMGGGKAFSRITKTLIRFQQMRPVVSSVKNNESKLTSNAI